jgi:fructokinase
LQIFLCDPPLIKGEGRREKAEALSLLPSQRPEVRCAAVVTQPFGAIEAGGTKFVCLVGTGPDDIRAETRFPTTTPERTLQQAIDFLSAEQDRQGPLAAVGIASFGPVDLRRDSPTYGYITSTPKPGWANVAIAGAAGAALGVPVGFDTDVNAAALAEQRWGAGRGLHSFIYLTIGTGIGGGGLLDGKLTHGLVHPEMGHIRVPHDLGADPFPGICPFHGDCLEGLASGPAMQARWRQPAEELPDDHPAWALEARYLALALATFVCTLSPQRIVMGGGVMSKPLLFPMIRRHVLELLNNYVRAPELLQRIDSFIVPPALGHRAGALGGLALAADAAQDPRSASPRSAVRGP